MKTKRFLALLLAAVMCLSMLMASCGNSEEEEEAAESEEKQVIIDNFKEINFKDIVTTTLDQLDQQVSYDSLLKEFNAEISGQASYDGGLALPFYLGVKDGLIKVESPNEESGYVFINNGAYVAVSPAYGTNEIYVSEIDDSSMPDWTELETYLTEDILNMLDSFKLNAPKEKQLKKSGDFYVLTNSYYEDVAEAVIDFAADISEEMDGYYPSEEEKAEAVTQINSLVAALNLELGFAVSGETVVGLKIALDPDVDMIESVLGGGAMIDPEMPMPDYNEDYYEAVPAPTAYASESEEAAVKCKVSLELMLTDDLMNIKSFVAELDYNMGVSAIVGSVSINTIISDNTMMGANISANATISDYYYTSESENAGNSNGYSSTSYYADYTASVNGFIDFTKSENVGEKVIDLKGELKITPTRKEVYAYDQNYNDVYVDYDPTDVSGVDPVSFNAGIEATVTKLGTINVVANANGAADGQSISVSGDGYISWMEAENFGAVPSDVAALMNDPDIAEKIADLERRIDETYFNVSYSDYSLWYDDVTGLYVLFNGSQYNYTILLGLPEGISYVQI